MEVPQHPEAHHHKKNWLLIAVCVLIGLNVLLAILVSADLWQEREKELVPSTKFSLLRPDIAKLNDEDFSSMQRSLYYRPLRESYDAIVNNRTNIGIYFEDLTSGSWVGVNERRKFVGASLLKTQLAATVLKKVEDGTLTLQDEIILQPSDLEEWIETRLTMGLPLPDFENQQTLVSPKEYSNIFRTFYLSTYLTREHSQYLLSLLSNTQFNDQLVAGVPEGITVSHKIGVRSEGDAVEKEFHDCGIIYVPKTPYMLCVMVEGVAQQDATAVIAEISEETYTFVTKQHQ
jgi:beta-lactamase class A